MTDKLIIPQGHYSTADWDFSSDSWILDTNKYTTPPSALRGTTPSPVFVLNKLPDIQNLPHGRIVTNLWLTYQKAFRLYFRNQAPLLSSNRENTYEVHLYASGALASYLNAYVAGELVGQWNFGMGFPWAEWLKIRVTWWTGKNLINVRSLACKLEKMVAGEWQQMGNILYDVQDRWQNSDVNRVGIGVNNNSWVDDTEIWG